MAGTFDSHTTEEKASSDTRSDLWSGSTRDYFGILFFTRAAPNCDHV